MSRSITSVTGRTKHKLVFLGDQGAGKSSIIERFINDKFEDKSNPTIGIDFLAKNFAVKNRSYRLQLWDTAGQQRFKSLIPGYLKDAICAIFVYDVSNTESLENIQKWIVLFKENRAPGAISVLCANKIDLMDRKQYGHIGQKFAKNHHMPYFEVSAKTGAHINDLFSGIIETITGKEKNGEQSQDTPMMTPKTFDSRPEISVRDTGRAINLKLQQTESKPKKKCCGKS